MQSFALWIPLLNKEMLQFLLLQKRAEGEVLNYAKLRIVD